jgi:hypothetical protein
MRYFDDHETFTENEIKDYFVSRNYFGIPKHICDGAKELVIFTKNYLITNEAERKEIETRYGGNPDEKKEFPFVIGYKREMVFYTSQIADFARHIPNENILELYLIRIRRNEQK